MTRIDATGTACICGIGRLTRGTLALVHRDPPNILRCTFCRVPYPRYEYPNLDKLKLSRQVKFIPPPKERPCS